MNSCLFCAAQRYWKQHLTPLDAVLLLLQQGKTCQTIAFLSWLKHGGRGGGPKRPAKDSALSDESDDASVGVTRRKRGTEDDNSANTTHPHLVIAPASVLSNWMIEFEKFAPDLKVVKYHGSMDQRVQIQQELRQFLPGKKRLPGAELDVVLAPITYFQKEKSDDRAFLRKFAWDYMVVDEGHVLKNAKGLRYKSLDSFSTMHRLLLTVRLLVPLLPLHILSTVVGVVLLTFLFILCRG